MFFKKKAKLPPITIVPGCVFQCLKEKCPKWVILMQDRKIEDKMVKIPVGKCADAWIPELMTEIIGELESIRRKK